MVAKADDKCIERLKKYRHNYSFICVRVRPRPGQRRFNPDPRRFMPINAISTPFHRHFNAVSTPFGRHFNAIWTPFQRHFNAIWSHFDAV